VWYLTPITVVSEVKHCGIRGQTPWCPEANTAVFWRKQCGDLSKTARCFLKTTWCFGANTVLFLKIGSLFFEGHLESREKVLWRG
jgi:hypothetical protein